MNGVEYTVGQDVVLLKSTNKYFGHVVKIVNVSEKYRLKYRLKYREDEREIHVPLSQIAPIPDDPSIRETSHPGYFPELARDDSVLCIGDKMNTMTGMKMTITNVPSNLYEDITVEYTVTIDPGDIVPANAGVGKKNNIKYRPGDRAVVIDANNAEYKSIVTIVGAGNPDRVHVRPEEGAYSEISVDSNVLAPLSAHVGPMLMIEN